MTSFGPAFDDALTTIHRLSSEKTRMEITLREAHGALEYAAQRADVVTSNALALTIERVAAALSYPLVREEVL